MSPQTPIDFALVIDAGHGGKDPGTTAGDLIEKDVNLSVASKLADLLAPQLAFVAPTRLRDEFVPLAERVLVANRHSGGWLLSVHVNAQGPLGRSRKVVRGCEAHVYSPDAPRVLQLAEALLAGVARAGIPYSPRKTFIRRKWALGTVLSPHLYVLRRTRQPAVLLELGYATSPEDARLLRSEWWQGKVAGELARSIIDWAVNSMTAGRQK